jgi:hypothetical protein
VNVVSFVDRDMVMRYFGGGIGHLKNAPPMQELGTDPIDTNSEEMPVEEDDDDPCGTNEDLGTIVQQPSKDVMNGDDEDEEDNDDSDDDEEDDDSDGDEDGDQTDEDEDEEGEDDYFYASA